jgi:predicted O-methyltransferase YrrM
MLENRKEFISTYTHIHWLMMTSIKNLPASLKEPYDLIFIDADKTSYPTYLSQILELSQPGSMSRLLRPGGIIVADNILRRALIADSSPANPWSTKEKQRETGRLWQSEDMEALDKFNKEMVDNERIDVFLLPLFDGLGLGRLVN